MNKSIIIAEYMRWMKKANADIDLIEELKDIQKDTSKIEDAFYKDLTFGTGGLRGIIGAGTNRINIYTIAKASQGLSDYLKQHFSKAQRKIAVSYDTRIKSDLFAKVAAEVFAANGIQVFMYSEVMPTPCLSFAVRELQCAAGIMITASHNPSQYNGYKVYGSGGCQITTEVADEILIDINKLDIFDDVKKMDYNEAVQKDIIQYISEDIYTKFIEAVKKQSMVRDIEFTNKNVAIVYSPLNGTGLRPVMRILEETGYTNITVVEEQALPDGKFSTCPYPNPEVAEAMTLGIEYAKKNNADIFLATDPDCDRVGIAVNNEVGEYLLLSGNELGMLLLDYICSCYKKNGIMPKEAVMMKTIVTTDMAERIAAHYGVKTINVLTGFKFIGEQIGLLEQKGKLDSYIFGFEESCGYLRGSYVRDKDGVNAAFLICEMVAFYKARGITLVEKLEELYKTYGYCLNTQHSFVFEGVKGFNKIQKIMEKFRGNIIAIGNKKIEECLDYNQGLNGLPKSNVLKFILENNCSMVVRPSGTEPKLKAYISVSAASKNEAVSREKEIAQSLENYIEEK